MPSHDEYLQALQTIEHLSPAPQVLAQVSRKIRDPMVEIDDLADIIKTDAALTGDIIQLSNSAYYGFGAKNTSVNSAMARVGFNEVLRMVNIAMSNTMINRNLDAYGITAYDYWASSLSCALIMENFSRLIDENPIDSYTTGIVHAIGRLVINQILNDFGASIFWTWGTPIEEWERNEVGYDFAYAGSELTKRWEFPDNITEAIANQLDPWSRPSPLSAGLAYAREIIWILGPELNSEDEWEPHPDTKFITHYGLDPDDVRACIIRARATGEHTRTTLGITPSA